MKLYRRHQKEQGQANPWQQVLDGHHDEIWKLDSLNKAEGQCYDHSQDKCHMLGALKEDASPATEIKQNYLL